MARAADNAAQDASSQYSQYATGAMNNYNTQAAQTGDAISQLGSSNPYTSKSYLTAQNLNTAAAADASDAQAKTQLQGQALRTGTNTAALGRTISSNAQASQRQMDAYNAGQTTQNQDKYLQLQQGLIGDRQNLANSQAQVYGTSANGQASANNNLTSLQASDEQMWGNIISAAAGAAGTAGAAALKPPTPR